jgi:molybdate/tungstate transport system ATP-binding protein
MTGPAIAVEGLSLTLGAFALREVSLAVREGEILVLLGPNGAGKSVTIETIAGFHRPRTGRIAIRGRDVTRLPPERRRVGLVFQDFGLFPHLSVAQNVAIGLRRHAEPFRGETPVPLGDVPALLAYFAIAHLADRKPQGLSAGEQQRTSLARALATRPDLLLFDEPFSALDAPTHDQLRRDLDHFVRDAGIPAIFVTHDPVDARVLADRIAVINQGTTIQEGTAAEVFERPCNAFVAAFVGVENILAGRIVGRDGDHARIAVGDRVLYSRSSAGERCGQRVAVCIRAEDVKLHLGGPRAIEDAAGSNRLPGRIVAVTNLGPLTKVSLDCGGFELAAYVMSGRGRDSGLVPGAEAQAEFDAASVHVALAG